MRGGALRVMVGSASIALLVLARSALADPAPPSNSSVDTRDHLEPAESVFDEQTDTGYYASLVTSVLSEGFDNRVQLRMLLLPSFRPESVVGVRQIKGGAYEIFVLQPLTHLWSFSSLRGYKAQLAKETDDFQRKSLLEQIKRLEAALPADPKDVQVRRCTTAINDADAKQIITSGDLLLKQTRYFDGEEVTGSDGDEYYFWAPVNLSGRIWWPSGGTKPARMVDIMETLRSSCERADRTLIVQAVSDARMLEKDLKAHEPQ